MFARNNVTHGLAVMLAVVAVTSAHAQERRGGGKNETVGIFKSADAATGSITIGVIDPGERGVREPTTLEKTFTLAKNAEIAATTGAGFGGRAKAALFREVKLSELAAGIRVSLTMAGDQKTVESVLAEGPTIHGELKGVDASKGTVTVLVLGRGSGRERGAEPEEKTFSVASDAEIGLDDGRGLRFSVKEVKLADLPQKALVTLSLHVDMKKAQAVLAEGPMRMGLIKTIDAGKKTVTIQTRGPGRGDDTGEEQTLTVADDALVLLDDGRGRRLSLKAGKLADVPAGVVATAKLSSDQVHITQLRVEGPAVTGKFKAVDAAKGVIIITIPKGRDDAEEKALTLSKDVQVRIDGQEAQLADLKLSDPPQAIQLRLSLDQKTVQAIVSQKDARR